MSNNHVERRETEAEIMNEYPGELTRALLELREMPSPRLQQRVAAIPHQEPARGRFSLSSHTSHTLWSRFAAGALATLAVLVVLFAVPQWRSAAAQTIAELWHSMGFGMATDPAGVVTFRPAPPFDVYQLSELPQGFELRTQVYQPATGGVVVEAEVVEGDGVDLPSATSASSVQALLARRVEVYKSNRPHIILVYQDEGDDYLLLFQRAVQSGEALPGGEPQKVAEWPAVMRQDGTVRTLTWVAGSTWLTLESTLPDRDLLQVANSLVKTQTAEEAEPVGPEAASDGPDLSEYPFCNPEDEPAVLADRPDTTVEGQRFGSVRIYFSDSDVNSERVSYGISVAEPDITPFTNSELLQRAIEALKSPDLILEPRTLPDILMLSPEEECLRRVPPDQEEDYITIEIVDERATVGYGGDGNRYVERALQALERELAQHR